MNARQLPSREYFAVKAAFAELVELLGGPTRAEKHTRVDAGRLSRYCAPRDPLYPPVDVVMDLEAQAGEPIVSRVMADIAGFALVTKAEARPAPDYVKHLGEVGEDAGGVLAALSGAISGGVNDKEAAAILPKVREAATTMAALETALEEQLDNVTLFRAAAR